MKRKRNIYRSIIALFFLAIFVNAIAKNITCDLGHLPAFSHHHPEPDDHAHSHAPGQHHHHSHEHDTDAPAQDHHDHKHGTGKEKEDDNCCSKLAKDLYSGLTKPAQAKFEFKKSITPFVTTHVESAATITVSYKAADYYSWKAPPPKIPDIRVLIHSFII